MTAYIATASSRHLYQKLVVGAASPQEAAAKFHAYLASSENQSAEEEEFQIVKDYEAPLSEDEWDELDDSPSERDDLTYRLDDDAVEEWNDPVRWSDFEGGCHSRPAGAAVEMVDSGGNSVGYVTSRRPRG